MVRVANMSYLIGRLTLRVFHAVVWCDFPTPCAKLIHPGFVWTHEWVFSVVCGKTVSAVCFLTLHHLKQRFVGRVCVMFLRAPEKGAVWRSAVGDPRACIDVTALSGRRTPGKLRTLMGFWVTLVWFLGALSELVTGSEPPPTVTSGRFTSTSATTKTYPLSRRFLQHNTKLNILVFSHERSILNVASWATTPVRRPRRFLTDSTQCECRAFFLEHG